MPPIKNKAYQKFSGNMTSKGCKGYLHSTQNRYAQPTVMSTLFQFEDPAMEDQIVEAHKEGQFQGLISQCYFISFKGAGVPPPNFDEYPSLKDIPEPERESVKELIRQVAGIYVRGRYAQLAVKKVDEKVTDAWGAEVTAAIHFMAQTYFSWMRPDIPFDHGELPFSHMGAISQEGLEKFDAMEDQVPPPVEKRDSSMGSMIENLVQDMSTQTASAFEGLTGYSPKCPPRPEYEEAKPLDPAPTAVCLQISAGSTTSSSSDEEAIPVPPSRKRARKD